MKKLVCFLMVVSVWFVFVGCNSAPVTSDIDTDDLDEKIKDDLWQLIVEEQNYAIKLIVISDLKSSEGKNVSIHLKENIEYFSLGDYFKAISISCRDYFSDNDILFSAFSISIGQTDGNLAFVFSTRNFESYLLTDHRSGEGNITRIESLDNLSDIFPAMKFAEAQSRMPDDVVLIYNEVLDKLYEQPDVPEELIFEQIAPSYSMTPYELKAFIENAMSGMYGGEYTPLPDDYGFTIIEAPESVYKTSGTENGLMNTAMYATGEIMDFGSVHGEFNYFILKNDFGFLLIAQDDIFGKVGNAQKWDELKKGDQVTVYFAYLGWIDEDFFNGGNGIYFTCLYAGEDFAEQKEWTQRWYKDYVVK